MDRSLWGLNLLGPAFVDRRQLQAEHVQTLISLNKVVHPIIDRSGISPGPGISSGFGDGIDEAAVDSLDLGSPQHDLEIPQLSVRQLVVHHLFGVEIRWRLLLTSGGRPLGPGVALDDHPFLIQAHGLDVLISRHAGRDRRRVAMVGRGGILVVARSEIERCHDLLEQPLDLGRIFGSFQGEFFLDRFGEGDGRGRVGTVIVDRCRAVQVGRRGRSRGGVSTLRDGLVGMPGTRAHRPVCRWIPGPLCDDGPRGMV